MCWTAPPASRSCRFRKSRCPRAMCRANGIRRPSPSPARRRPSPSRASTEADLVDWTPEIKARALEIASHYNLAAALHAAAGGHRQDLRRAEPAGPAGRRQLAGRLLRSGDPYRSTSMPRTSSRSPASASDRTARSIQRGGQPAAGSADANGGAFGGVASLKGAVGPRPRLDRAATGSTIRSCRA